MKVRLEIDGDASELAPVLLALIDPRHMTEVIAETVQLAAESLRGGSLFTASGEAEKQEPMPLTVVEVDENYSANIPEHGDEERVAQQSTPAPVVEHEPSGESAEATAEPAPAPPDTTQVDRATGRRSRWTPEMKDEHSRKMKERWAERKREAGYDAPSDPMPTESYDSPITPARKPLPSSNITIPPRIEEPEEPFEITEALPSCQCPPRWWTEGAQARGEPMRPSDRHSHLCPLHRHRYVLPSATNGDGVYEGKCACGATKTHAPYAGEPPLPQTRAEVRG